MSVIYSSPIRDWNATFSENEQTQATEALEKGRIIFFPDLDFVLHDLERVLLSPEILSTGTKNISYNPALDQAKGCDDNKLLELAKPMMIRYLKKTQQLMEYLFPHYQGQLELGRTSYRPAEIEGRPSSYTKNDTLLHIDAFPSTPTQGKRILRIFANINPAKSPRVWRVGHSFTDVIQSILPQCKPPLPGLSWLLELFGITKVARTPYDHYMLQLHDRMKADHDYQTSTAQTRLELPSASTWMVYTDQSPHAVISGQYLMEQTFYLPAAAMQHPELSPLKILESQLHCQLV